MRRWHFAAFIVSALACTEGPTSPNDQADQLAAALEGLSRECNQQGDADGSLAFTYAAMAVRLGVEPNQVTLKLGDEERQYLAFVHVVRHGPPEAISLRTLVAFRPKTSTDRRPAEVLYVGTSVDSTGIEHPAAAGPEVHATAVWKDLAANQTWVATTGKAGVSLAATGAPCPRATSAMSIQCTLATYAIFVDGDFHQALGGSETNLQPNPILGIRVRADSVNGASIIFTD